MLFRQKRFFKNSIVLRFILFIFVQNRNYSRVCIKFSFQSKLESDLQTLSIVSKVVFIYPITMIEIRFQACKRPGIRTNKWTARSHQVSMFINLRDKLSASIRSLFTKMSK